jgi:hypothetical protein
MEPLTPEIIRAQDAAWALADVVECTNLDEVPAEAMAELAAFIEQAQAEVASRLADYRARSSPATALLLLP